MIKKCFLFVILFAQINFSGYALAEPRPMKARQSAFRLEFEVYRTEDMPPNWFRTYDGFYVTKRIDNNWVYGQRTMEGMKMTNIIVGSVDPSDMPELNEAYTYVPPGAKPVYIPPLPPEMMQKIMIQNDMAARVPDSATVHAPAQKPLRTMNPYELAKTGTPDELIEAVRAGVNFNVEVKEFGENGELNPDFSYEFGYNETPLHYAAYYNRNPESIRFLLELGLAVNAEFYSGNSFMGDCLSLAVASKNLNAIRELLRHGANPNTWSNIWINEEEYTEEEYSYLGSPLHIIASRYKDNYSVTRDVINAVIKAGGNVNYRYILNADEKEFLKNVKLSRRSEWTSQNPMDNIKYDSQAGLRIFRATFTPLMFAVLYDNVDVADILLDHKADANIRNAEGKTALDYANDLPANSAIKRSDVFNKLKSRTKR